MEKPDTDAIHDDVTGNGPAQANPFDTKTGYSGQEYHRDREAQLGRQSTDRAASETPDGGQDIPPDNGHRASVDPKTGEVHGSGSGAGGGNPGEDYDSDPASGDGFMSTASPPAKSGKD